MKVTRRKGKKGNIIQSKTRRSTTKLVEVTLILHSRIQRHLNLAVYFSFLELIAAILPQMNKQTYLSSEWLRKW